MLCTEPPIGSLILRIVWLGLSIVTELDELIAHELLLIVEGVTEAPKLH